MNGYFIRHWRGELGLALAFWVNGMFALFAPSFVTAIWQGLDANGLERPGGMRVAACAFVAMFCGRVAVRLWANVGVWRSAGRYLARGGRPVWGQGAKAYVLAFAVIELGILVYVSGSGSGYRDMFEIAVGREPYGHATIQVSADGETVLVSGKLGEGFAAELISTLHRSRELRTVQLTSPGGRMYEAIPAARALRAANLRTRAVGRCYSACTILFLSGRERSVAEGASLLFHRPDLSGVPESLREREMEKLVSYYRSVGATPELLDRVRALRGNEDWVPKETELVDYQIVTRPSARVP